MSRALRRGASYVQNTMLRCLVSPMATQIGGHKPGGINEGMLALDSEPTADHLDGLVLKPVQTGQRGAREVSLYEAMTQGDAYWLRMPITTTTRKNFAGLVPFLCNYHGVVALGPQMRHIVLADCTDHMSRPCVLDVKLGTRTAEHIAPMKKQRSTLAKYPCQSELGCRLVGMRVWSQCESKYLEYDKLWGFSLRDKAAIRQGLVDFLGGFLEFADKQNLIADLSRRIRALLDWFEGQDQLVFISSSLLLVYDGGNDGNSNTPKCVPLTQLKIIDFAHVRKEDSPDYGYIAGLRMVAQLLGDISKSEGGRRPPFDRC